MGDRTSSIIVVVAFIIGLTVFYSASVHPLTLLRLTIKSLTLTSTGEISYGFRYTPPTFFFNATLIINNTSPRDITLQNMTVMVFVNDTKLDTKTDLESSLQIPARGYYIFHITGLTLDPKDYEKLYDGMLEEKVFIATIIIKGVSLSHKYSTLLEKTWNFYFHFLHTPSSFP